MSRPGVRWTTIITTCLVTIGLAAPAAGMPAADTAPAAPAAPAVLASGTVLAQDIGSQPGSETDTVVEPDVAVSPIDKDVAIAAAHDSRFPDGGAVDISASWTADGGTLWHHAPVQGITAATGGPYERASDPVVAFGPDGTGYLSVLVFDATTCRTAVAVLRTSDGGQHWSAPFYAHRSNSCDYSDDKNWIVVDNSAASPHYGRVYQFWTAFRSKGEDFKGSPQAVRWSDDRARTWSRTSYVTAIDHGTQASQPMIEPDGTVIDAYYDYGAGFMAPDVVAPGSRPGPTHTDALAPADIDAEGTIYTAASVDGGRTWGAPSAVVTNAGGYADGVRCCLFGADIDATTHRMFIAYEGGVGDTDPVYEVFSDDGYSWSSPVPVSRGDVPGVQRVNVDVVALKHRVYVDYGTRTDPGRHGSFVRQQLSVSTDSGRSFGAPATYGPVSALQYAAQAGGYFPGDYIGLAIAPGRLYGVWAVSSKPPAGSGSKYHQIIYGVTLKP